ncbi:MAG: hypothetical protein ACTSRL_21385 [Candidatus Helarchaeota archaeon]
MQTTITTFIKPKTKPEKEISIYDISRYSIKKIRDLCSPLKLFNEEQVSDYNRYTHFPVDLNEEFQYRMSSKITMIENKFNQFGIEELPQDILNALIDFKEGLYRYYLNESKIRNLAPSVLVVGAANYPIHNLQKIKNRKCKNIKHIEEIEIKLDKIVSKYLKEEIHKKHLQQSKDNPRIKFESKLKVGDKVEGRFVHNHVKYRFPGEVVGIYKSTIRIKTLKDNIPYKGEQKGRIFSLPFGFNEKKSKNNGVFPLIDYNK